MWKDTEESMVGKLRGLTAPVLKKGQDLSWLLPHLDIIYYTCTSLFSEISGYLKIGTALAQWLSWLEHRLKRLWVSFLIRTYT